MAAMFISQRVLRSAGLSARICLYHLIASREPRCATCTPDPLIGSRHDSTPWCPMQFSCSPMRR
ncbi:MAG: hypothetical protein DMF50_12925 [Acidobacteria bacterium]|nr:MAG: hypothetical protein DMF50_12925 [Acidobacteriota bacterium]